MSVQQDKLTAIADAIRAKDGTAAKIAAKDFPDRILAIDTVPKTMRTISVTSGDTALGTVSGGGLADSGMEVVVTAAPKGSSVFKNWTENGTVLSTNKKYSFNVNRNISLVGNFGSGYVSGVDWMESKLPETGNWSSVAYGGGKFVAVQNGGGTAAYSTDGVHWIKTDIPSGYYGFVAYGGGLFIAFPSIYSEKHIAYSSNGIEWQQTSWSLGEITGAVYGGNKFVAVGSNTNAIMYSTNGTTWNSTRFNIVGRRFGAVTYGNGKFVTIGDSAGNESSRLFTSTDGIDWSGTSLSSIDNMRGIAFGGSRFVCVTYDDGNRFSSDNGESWQGTGSTSYHWNAVAYGDGKFVTVASSNSGSNMSSYSTDAINWTNVKLPITAKWQSIAYGGGKFVALAAGADTLLYSYTGT